MFRTIVAERLRLEANQNLNPERKAEFGQYMTPARIAEFMAYLFSPGTLHTIRLLDAGAGIGTLTAAFLERCLAKDIETNQIEVTAYEIDPLLRAYLTDFLAGYHIRAQEAGVDLKVNIVPLDFIEDAVDRILYWKTQAFTHAILNPPYKKIHSHSQHRKSLRVVGIETVNLYTAFVALTIDLMDEGGEIVAIIPRSFCNGPYYRPFRELLLRKTAIQHLHLFGARDRAFQDDEVLQENVIVHLVKSGHQETVTVSTATDGTLADFQMHEVPFTGIVAPDDPECFIRIPTTVEQNILESSPVANYTLRDLRVEVSTGPVVDFRLKPYLRDQPAEGTVPLLYPAHFTNEGVVWPSANIRKPNALQVNAATEKWLFPNGFYTVVRRFSSKEERRRITASVVNPSMFDAEHLGFENHLNVYHQGKRGLSEDVAYGLAIFLNSTAVDDYFRQFNGHTQVNATDLRLLKYPAMDTLIALGQWAKNNKTLSQQQIDEKIELILCPSTYSSQKP
jgi:predicted RNA methylase